MTDYTNPATIDIDEVIANVKMAQSVRADKWDDTPSWPNVTVAALADEVTALRREIEFVELLCDGGQITVNGVPWREMFERVNAIISDPIRVTPSKLPELTESSAPQ